MTRFFFACLRISSLRRRRSISTARFFWGMSLNWSRKASSRIENSGLSRPAFLKMSMTSSVATDLETSCLMAVSRSRSVGSPGPPRILASWALTAWKKPTSSRIFMASGLGTERANAAMSCRAMVRTRSAPSSMPRMNSTASLRMLSFLEGLPLMKPDQSNPSEIPHRISCFSSMMAMASSWLKAGFAQEPLAALLVGVGDVFQEDKAKDDVFVLRGVHGAAQRVGGFPELFLVADVSLGVSVAAVSLGGFSGFRAVSWWAGHEGCESDCLEVPGGMDVRGRVPAGTLAGRLVTVQLCRP